MQNLSPFLSQYFGKKILAFVASLLANCQTDLDNVLLRARTLQRQDASASYQDPAYQSYPDPWAEPLQPNGYIPGPPPPPAPGPVTNTFTRNSGVRRRLPDDTYAKKKPWHNLLTGWSTDDLTQNRENQNHQYNNGTSNGYPGNGNVTLTVSHLI